MTIIFFYIHSCPGGDTTLNMKIWYMCCKHINDDVNLQVYNQHYMHQNVHIRH